MSRFSRSQMQQGTNRAALLEALRQKEGLSDRILRRTTTDPIPLSFAQQRLWLLEQLYPGQPLYHLPVQLRIRGPLDRAALHTSLQQLIQRHEMLRTVFVVTSGKPYQNIVPSLDIPLLHVDLQTLAPDDRDAERLRQATDFAQQPFDLSKGPLLRALLFQLEPDTAELMLVIHHIIADGWSMGPLWRDLFSFYQAQTQGQEPVLAPLPIQYGDFALWQREWLSGTRLDEQLAYWKQQLQSPLPVLELPTDFPRPAQSSLRGDVIAHALPSGLSQSLTALSQSTGTTLFMTVLSAFAVLLARYSSQTDIVIGTPIANRQRRELADLIGFFVNTLVLRVNLKPREPFRQVLGHVREVLLDAYAHQDLPFEKLVEVLQPDRDLSHAPLFNVMCVLQNAPTHNLAVPSLHVEQRGDISTATSKFDLTLILQEEANGQLLAVCEYSQDLFKTETITRLLVSFQTLLENIVANPDTPWTQIPLLSLADQHALVYSSHALETAPDTVTLIHHRIAAHAAHTPESAAVMAPDRTLSYQDLDRQAEDLAAYLRSYGVGPDKPVGVLLERSSDLIVALLAIWKSGGAYLPLNPSLPTERFAFVLDDAAPVLVLTHTALRDRLPQDTLVILLDHPLPPASAAIPDAPSTRELSADHLAYIIYTSGSTGRPKGVLVTHRGLDNMVSMQQEYFGPRVGSRVLLFSSISFDASIFEILLALGTGATLVIAERDDMLPGPPLARLLANQRITHLNLQPSGLAALLAVALPDLVTIVVGGETCPIDLVNRWAPERRFYNGYGPTEATMWMTVAQCVPGSSKPSIGKPIRYMQVYVLDRELQPVPIGVPGELYIGGVGLARGYCNRPDLTAERFVPHPFSAVPGARLYKTGDLVRWRFDNELDFLGRIDQQVKIRGYRVELEEIEAVLLEHPAVQATVVRIWQEPGVPDQLVAYVVPSTQQEPKLSDLLDELRHFLQPKLPDYMVPSVFVLLEALPLTPSGKIDRRALPSPSTISSKPFVAPTSALEEVIAGIWADILGREQIGITENFFELGGHSLLASQVIAHLYDVLQVEVPLRAFFETPTVAGIATSLLNDPAQQARAEQNADLVIQLSQMSDEAIVDMLQQDGSDARPAEPSELQPTKESKPLVILQPSGDRTPLICIHAMSGQLLPYNELLPLLPTNQPVYGIQMPDGHLMVSEQMGIETLATRYIQAIREHYRSGAVKLLGWSFGGVIAFEMARQMEVAGEPVEFLGLIDSYPMFGTHYAQQFAEIDAPFLVHLAHDLQETLNIPSLEDFQARSAQEREDYLLERALSIWPGTQSATMMRNQIALYKAYHLVLCAYQPRNKVQKLTLLRAQGGIEAQDTTLGWQDYSAQGVDVYSMPGNHYTMLQPPHIYKLAEVIQRYLVVEMNPS